MPEYDVPILSRENLGPWLKFFEGAFGDGPAVEEPEFRPVVVQIWASNKGEAAKIAEGLHPDHLAVRKAIKEHKNDT